MARRSRTGTAAGRDERIDVSVPVQCPPAAFALLADVQDYEPLPRAGDHPDGQGPARSDHGRHPLARSRRPHVAERLADIRLLLKTQAR